MPSSFGNQKIEAGSDALFSQAFALHQQGKIGQAQALYRRILEQSPGHFDSLNMLGTSHIQQGQIEAGITLLSEAIVVNPASGVVHYNRGHALQRLRRFSEALSDYERSLALQPDILNARFCRANVLRELGRFDDAVCGYDEVLAVAPDHVNTLCNRGNALRQLERYEEAKASYDRALSLKPDDLAALTNRGLTFMDFHRMDEALADFNRALALDPNYVDARQHRATVLHFLGRVDEVLAGRITDIDQSPSYADAYLNTAFALLQKGQFERGWQLYEWRWRQEKSTLVRRDYLQPLWLGKESLAGKTILLYGEQGLGDSLQFCRYARLVRGRGARVMLEMPKSLLKLFGSLPGVDVLIEAGATPPDFDFHCPLLSLPLACRTFSFADIPVQVPYLRVPLELLTQWKNKLGPRTRLRVGLVWNGGYRPLDLHLKAVNERRNIDFSLLAKIRHPAIDFYSLQKGEPAESELPAQCARYWPEDNLHVHVADLNDFADTAALIMQLDLVIAVDTSTAHLAAALGKPVWLLNRFDSCWRWFLEREDSPWYPELKIYRQSQYGQWPEVIERLRLDLWALAGVTP